MGFSLRNCSNAYHIRLSVKVKKAMAGQKLNRKIMKRLNKIPLLN